MSRFRFVGDHSGLHCGCQAVAEVIAETLEPHGMVVGPKDDFDTLVVNGEGSMHHGAAPFLMKMHEIRVAQDAGKQTYLINSVWQDNPAGYDDCLSRLDGICVRGVASARDLQANHGISAPISIDLSYFSEIDETAPVTRFDGDIVVTDVYSRKFGFVWLSEKRNASWTRLDMSQFCWSGLVKSLRTARLLVAGRHHGIFAACRARIPFVAIRGNSHKIEDLLKTAGSPIPIANTVADATHLIKWARANPKAYDDLYGWMDEQPRWEFPGAKARTGSLPPDLPKQKQLAIRASEAVFKRNFEEAQPLWQTLLDEKGDNLPYPRLACMAFFASGHVETGMEVLARTRIAKPGSVIFAKLLMQYARHQTIWIERSVKGSWWPAIGEAAHQAKIGNVSCFDRLVETGMAAARKTGGPVLASSVNFFLACRLVQLVRHDLAFKVRRAFPVDDAPEWIRDQEDILLDALCRRFTPDAKELLAKAERLECWADPSFRATVMRYRILYSGVDFGILDAAAAHLATFPGHAELRDIFISAMGEAQEWARLESGDSGAHKYVIPPAQLENLAARHLPLAAHLVATGLSEKPALQKRKHLFEAFIRGRDELISLLTDTRLRIAVVGNSPVELGKAHGNAIDLYDIVIRFNDFSTLPPFDRDYGSKTDIVVQSYPLTEALSGKSAAPDYMLVQRHAFNIFDPRDWAPVLGLATQGQKLAFMPREAYSVAAKELGATPSAGFALAVYMKQLRGSIDRSDFYGFSFTDQLSNERKAHYFNDENPSLIHDWEREALQFEKLFQSEGKSPG